MVQAVGESLEAGPFCAACNLQTTTVFFHKRNFAVSATEENIARKKTLLGSILTTPMEEVAAKAASAWWYAQALDGVLRENFARLGHCDLLYALDINGTQVSANVGPERLEFQWRGQDLSARPYLVGSLPYQGFILSNVYLSQRTLEPCITAVQAVRARDQLLGFIAADFHVHTLPDANAGAAPAMHWRQFKGDPAIRNTLFMQRRTPSVVDEHIDDVISIMDTLVRRHGIFHGKLHFSSSRFTLWHVDDPYNYRLHAGREVTDPELCLAYAPRSYPAEASVEADRVRPVLNQLRLLREVDDTIYLRSGSVNVINGMVGLNFSCDGSHYMTVDEFLDRDLSFWLGNSPDGGVCADLGSGNGHVVPAGTGG